MNRKFGQAISFTAGGIKCDTCDFKESAVTADSYPQWLNKPCPWCGDNLLTEKDYASLNLMIKIIKVTNAILFPFVAISDSVRWVLNKPAPDKQVRLNMDGTGTIKVKEVQ